MRRSLPVRAALAPIVCTRHGFLSSLCPPHPPACSPKRRTAPQGVGRLLVMALVLLGSLVRLRLNLVGTGSVGS